MKLDADMPAMPGRGARGMKRSLTDIRENLDYVSCDNETARELCDEVERLRAIVDRLPTTADGVPIAPGDRLHDGRRNVVVTVTGYQVRSDGTLGVLHFGHGFDVSVCTKESYYADPDKAEAARMKLDTGDAGEGE